MMMFQNPGVMPVEAVRLMGASAKTEGAFGRFGTGLKYSIASILRGGGSIAIWAGLFRMTFELQPVKLKEKSFEEIVLRIDHDGRRSSCHLGVTTQLGKHWEPWMVLRELGCNALDEGGEIIPFTVDDPDGWVRAEEGVADQTFIIVDWPELDAAYADTEAAVFLPSERELLLDEGGVQVRAGKSAYLYHRGVRVWQLPKPSIFTYDITSDVDLTEDRTVQYAFCVEATVRNAILATDDRGIIAAAVTAPGGTWEGNLDWGSKTWAPREPGTAWLEEVALLRDREQFLSKSALDLLLSHSAFQKAERYYGGTYEEVTGTFGDVAAALEELDVNVSKENVFVSAALPGAARSSIKGGSIYLSKALVEEGTEYELARELLTRWLELRSGGNHDTLLKTVVPLMMDTRYEWKEARKELEKYALDNPVKAAVEAAIPEVTLLYEPSVAAAPSYDDDLPF